MIFVKITELDHAIFRGLFKPNAPKWWQILFVNLSKTGDGYVYIAFAGILLYLNSPQSLSLLNVLLLGFLIERPLYYALKNVFKRTRPCHWQGGISFIIPSDQFSLPSGHSAAAWVFAVSVACFLPQYEVLLFTWASLVALSRVMLGVHYPLDIVLGSFMGYGCAHLSMQITGVL
ncbi:hypothetical protein PULV_a3365 [Pseudoalteromonas ulvae UL12]|uniref:undecaprenyl-diphosphate phosphatase n=1 Tax=Pseudoalteromonas ulvae TaxID=107327 RepID=A0A244CPS1_PSEDV|nr:phosphatase PAP2 family protein [Pseudoalteromonas ulvae]MBE0365056.1 hypothetical protein [Pseudoalteromonas ulvae UL12]OUL57613.1 hypothetical protein B1199_11125 [Pseudoalteromonas ulvae]